MDAYEAARIVFSRIQALYPDNAAQIMGLLLIQDHGEKEMIRLAFGPEAFLHSVILKARKGPLSPCSPLSLLSRQNSSRSGPTSPSAWAPHLPFSRSNISGDGCGGVADDEFLLQEQQISFLNEQEADPGGYWDQGGFGWKPCLYFARGFCKNGSSCRFVHGPSDDMSAAAAAAAAVEQQCHEIMLMRSKSQRLAASAAVAAAFPYSPTGSSSCKNLNLMLQQQQNERQRVAMAAATALMLENENHKFIGRPRMERDFTGMMITGSRQIYLTFPADSTFRKEDVSNYFSIYGPVEDVRIPHQQKRMFGFVTFVYPETVKIVLAKGNPHFVCDSRVLVKPYKEKGMLPDKKQQHAERFDFSGCTTPTGFDSRDPFDIQQLMSPRMMCGGNNHDLLVRRKMEEQLAAAELQQAIEMQGRRFMGLQLLDINNRFASPTAPILSPLVTPNSTAFNNNAIFSDAGSSSNGSNESHDEDKSLSPASTGTAALSAAAAFKQQAAVDSGESEPTPNEDMCYQQSAEHNLPDSPFSSPTKSSIVSDSFFVANEESSFETSNGSSNGHLNASSLLPASSPLESMNPFKSYFLQIPRFSSGNGAVGL